MEEWYDDDEESEEELLQGQEEHCVYFDVWDYIEFHDPTPIPKLPDDFNGKELLAFNSWESYVKWYNSCEYYIGYIQVNV